MDVADWRGKLGIYGVSGDRQTLPMETMSPGFRARVVFCLMSLRNPQMLLLDEPTNPLDMDMCSSAQIPTAKPTSIASAPVPSLFRVRDRPAR